MAGDLRMFYLLWLTAVEADGFDPDEPEPMPRLGPMNARLEAFEINKAGRLTSAQFSRRTRSIGRRRGHAYLRTLDLFRRRRTQGEPLID
jgi:hypothetical protein